MGKIEDFLNRADVEKIDIEDLRAEETVGGCFRTCVDFGYLGCNDIKNYHDRVACYDEVFNGCYTYC